MNSDAIVIVGSINMDLVVRAAHVPAPGETVLGHDFVTIPEGSVIETSRDLNEPGLHPLTFENRSLLAFTRDIKERTEYLHAMARNQDND